MQWNNSLSVGVEQIDSQHKALFAAVNDLFDACGRGLGRKKIAKTMEFLHNYVLTHFSDEEKLQQRVGYPEYPQHRQLHRDFVNSLLGFEAQLEREGPTIGLVANFNTFVSNWLIYHISREDKKIGEYIRSHGS